MRRNQPALRGEGLRVPQTHEFDRVIVIHRWQDGEPDVVVVANLNERRLTDYRIDLPEPGSWRLEMNTDRFDRDPDPQGPSNGSSVTADGSPGFVYAQTTRLTIPANSAIILIKDQ